MRIIRNFVETSTLEEFADKYRLDIRVTERPKKFVSKDTFRYYASFIDRNTNYSIDEVGASVLIGTYGNGNSEEEAIENYAKQISEKIIRIGKENIPVPRIIAKWNLKLATKLR